MSENKNLLIAAVLIGLILLGSQYFFPSFSVHTPAAPTAAQNHMPPHGLEHPVVSTEAQMIPRDQALKKQARVAIEGASVHGSICLEGARIDDITLTEYFEKSIQSGSQPQEKVHVLSPQQTPHPYWVSFGWSSADPTLKTPDDHSAWHITAGERLTQSTPVTLAWKNGQGLTFQRTFEIDNRYMITVTERVINTTDKSVKLVPFSRISRVGLPKTENFFILHEGAIGVFNDKLQEVDYDDLQEKSALEYSGNGGWAGFTDKYWLTALIPSPHMAVLTRFKSYKTPTGDRFDTEMVYPEHDIAPHETVELKENVFSGAKQLHLLDAYAKSHQVARFDLAIDFGWFYFLTKPIFYLLNFLNDWIGNFGLSILALTVLIKLLLFPLANKSYRSMAKMKKLQPELQKLKERFGDDKIKTHEAMMDLYKRYQINPMAGCVPVILQIPVFFALYKVLFVTIEMRHAPFFGWIHDLSAPDPTTFFNLFGLIPWDPPSFLMIGLWPLVMGGTMFLQQRLNPQVADPIQAKMFMIMPVAFTFLLAQFAAGLVIYWAWNNILSISQQWLIMRLEARPAQDVSGAAANSNRGRRKKR